MTPTGAHLHPTAALAPRALLCGDPGRALAVARQLVDGPKMFNHHRGLWGYTGPAADGEPLTVQATGIGAASAATVLAELCSLGLRRAVRIGTCTTVGAGPSLGAVVAVREALAHDGVSRALGAADRVAPDPELLERLAVATTAAAVTVSSSDLYYTPDGPPAVIAPGPGADVADLSTAAVLQLGRRRGVRVAAVLAVTRADDEHLSEDAVAAAVAQLGRAGAAALGL